MQVEGISVDTSHVGDLVVVTVHGEIDLGSAPILQETLDALAPEQHVVLDCAGVEFIDSTGLHLVVTQAQRLENGGGSLRLRNAGFPVRHVIEITGLIQLIGPDD